MKKKFCQVPAKTKETIADENTCGRNKNPEITQGGYRSVYLRIAQLICTERKMRLQAKLT